MRGRKEAGRSQCDRLSRSAVVGAVFISSHWRGQHAAQPLRGGEANDGNLVDSLRETCAFYRDILRLTNTIQGF